MVKLGRAVGYRVKIPDLTDKTLYGFGREIYDLTHASFVEPLKLSNHVAIIVPEGVGLSLEKLLDAKGYSWKEADVHLVVRRGK